MSDVVETPDASQSPDAPGTPDEPAAGGRRRRIAPMVVGLVAIVLVSLFAILVMADPSRDETARSPLLGNLAPDVQAVAEDGSTFELSHRKGSWVVLNFFTHDCVPCVREHPDLIEFVGQQRALGSEGAEFYSVVRDSTRDEVEAFFDERGGDWPIVYDTDYEFVNGFGVAQVPETWVVDPNGFVRRRFIGQVTAEGLSATIQAMREGAA
jgi:cytochrome c biogenesis protein CcmG/thiol:disulfide interchange protein DsbE